MVAPIGRRGFVVGTAALSAGLWPLRPGHAAATMDFDEARHLLSRTTFGATPAEIHALEAQDYVATVDRLLGNVRRDAVTAPPGWLHEGPAELQRQVQAARAEAAEAKGKTGVDGKPLQPRGISSMIRRLGQLAGISHQVRTSPHTFRHTAAIQYLRNKGDQFTLQIMLGHSTLEMSRRYVSTLGVEDMLKVHQTASPVENWRL